MTFVLYFHIDANLQRGEIIKVNNTPLLSRVQSQCLLLCMSVVISNVIFCWYRDRPLNTTWLEYHIVVMTYWLK